MAINLTWFKPINKDYYLYPLQHIIRWYHAFSTLCTSVVHRVQAFTNGIITRSILRFSKNYNRFSADRQRPILFLKNRNIISYSPVVFNLKIYKYCVDFINIYIHESIQLLYMVGIKSGDVFLFDFYNIICNATAWIRKNYTFCFIYLLKQKWVWPPVL